MKITRYLIYFIMLLILFFSIWNTASLIKCRQQLKANIAVQNDKISNLEQIIDASIIGQVASMKHLDKTLIFDDLSRIFPGDSQENNISDTPKLVIVIDELGCNVCSDDETKFAVGIANTFGTHSVMAIVHADDIRYARNYIRMNQVNFPVYFSKSRSFLTINEIKDSPMLFLLGSQNRFVASHFPIPGHPEFSEPIHRYCYHYFSREKTGTETFPKNNDPARF